MTFFDFTLAATAAALVWFWFDSLAAREAGVAAARKACQSEGLQLLDETIALERVRFGRNERGTLMLNRVYAFEYSDTGNNRLRGSVHLLGSRVTLLDIGSLLLTE
ncbi:DUF3301 domain-containing protein [Methyloterricola oryzae]|uniref:DUF3301 domain-containing protein n=1 Tax=Methyloterricola oryzae TaxID=1495050 RepID=UPI0005EB79D2|nr:DUF3301 domain-containing protein [Methyloterricola oryzae]